MSHPIHTFIKRNSSKILSVAASFGAVATGIFGGFGMYKALKAVEKKEKSKPNLSTKEKILIALPHFAPCAGFAISTIACIFGANFLNKKKQDAISSAYMLLSNSYREYRNKLKELNGDDVDFQITSKIASEKFPEGKVSENKILFYDRYSERYFESTMADVALAIYHFNRNFQLRGTANLNEFYEFLGIEKVPYGDYMGFNSWQMAEDGLTPWIDIHTYRAVNCDGGEYVIIQFDWDPISDCEDWEPDYYKN